MKKTISFLTSLALCLMPLAGTVSNTVAADDTAVIAEKEAKYCEICGEELPDDALPSPLGLYICSDCRGQGMGGTTTGTVTTTTTTTTTTTSISLSSSLIFDNDLELHGNDTKEFHYKYNDIDSISFSVKSDNINIENEYKDGEGTLKVTTNHCPSGMKTLVCSLRKGLGEIIKTEIPIEILFKCPNCGKLVHDEDVAKTASGHDVCLECYNAGVYVGTTTSTATTTTTTTTTETTTSYIRSTPVGGISADSIPDEVTIQSGEEMTLNFMGMYITGVKAVSSDESVVKAEAEIGSGMFLQSGTLTLKAGKTDKTKTAEVEFFYDTFIAQDGGSKVIKVTVAGEKDEPVDSTDQSFVNELFADFKAGAKNALSLRHYLAQDITFTSDCEYLTFVRSGYNEPGVVQYDAAPNVIVIGDSNLYSPNSATMYVYVDENAPTGKATVNMSYTSLSTGKEVKKSFDVDILSKEDAALTTTTTLPYTTTTTTTTYTITETTALIDPIYDFPIDVNIKDDVVIAIDDNAIIFRDNGRYGIQDTSRPYLSDVKAGMRMSCHFSYMYSPDPPVILYVFEKEILEDKADIEPTMAGDVNCDDQVNMADAVLIMQSVSNPDKYGIGLTTGINCVGAKNADVDGSGDVTNMDALTIQKFKLHIIDNFS